MFILDGKPLPLNAPFAHDGISYPANWLRLASPDERAAIGITEEPDPEPCDQRFYWGPGLPKDHAQLVPQWISHTRITAGALLQPTDWLVIREADNGTPCPAAIKTWREAIRIASGDKEAAITATADTDALAAYIASADFTGWPEEP